MRNATLPITLILIGVVWLLVHFKLFPDRNWLIAVGLIAGGISVLMATGSAWWLHNDSDLGWSVLLPSLLICLGALMLVARLDAVPEQRPGKAVQP